MNEEMIKEIVKKVKERKSFPKWISGWCRSRTIPTELKYLEIEIIEELTEIAKKELNNKKLTKSEKEKIKTFESIYEYIKENLDSVIVALELFYNCCKKMFKNMLIKYSRVE